MFLIYNMACNRQEGGTMAELQLSYYMEKINSNPKWIPTEVIL